MKTKRRRLIEIYTTSTRSTQRRQQFWYGCSIGISVKLKKKMSFFSCEIYFCRIIFCGWIIWWVFLCCECAAKHEGSEKLCQTYIAIELLCMFCFCWWIWNARIVWRDARVPVGPELWTVIDLLQCSIVCQAFSIRLAKSHIADDRSKDHNPNKRMGMKMNTEPT